MPIKVCRFFLIVALFEVANVVRAYEIQAVNNCGRRLYVKYQARSGNGEFSIDSSRSNSFQVTQNARVWAHSGCAGSGNCDTSEGYVSLAEMHWDDQGKTWYDVSMVDGYNLPITMQPYSNTGGRCETVGCNFDLNSCPGDSKVYKNGRLVACRNNNRDAVTGYSQAMKNRCPNVYTWSKDDYAGMRDCQPGNGGLRVIFC